MNTKYPRQVVAIKRQNKVLGVDAWLFTPGEKDNASPLETVGYSRFVMTLIDNSQGEMITPKANIPADEVKYIKYQTELAMQQMAFEKTFRGRIEKKLDVVTTTITNAFTSISSRILEALKAVLLALGIDSDKIIGHNKESDTQNKNETTLKSSLAYTQKLLDKKFKDKTPAEVLLEDPNNKAELLRTRSWLNSNLERYPANKQQIDAIDEAIALLDIGELSATETQAKSDSDGSIINIYNTDFKFFSTTKEGTNEHQIYNVNIVCDTAKKYPFIVNIQNCYAPVIDGAGGQKKIQTSVAHDVKKSSIMMTDKEWFSAISKVESVLEHFEAMTFKEQYEIMKANSYQG